MVVGGCGGVCGVGCGGWCCGVAAVRWVGAVAGGVCDRWVGGAGRVRKFVGDLVTWLLVIGVLWAAAAGVGYLLGRFVVATSEWGHSPK